MDNKDGVVKYWTVFFLGMLILATMVYNITDAVKVAVGTALIVTGYPKIELFNRKVSKDGE